MRWLASRDPGGLGVPALQDFPGREALKQLSMAWSPTPELPPAYFYSLRDSNSVLPDTWLMADSRGSLLYFYVI